jgi:transposase
MAMRKKFDSAFRAKVALEALKGEKTMNQISAEYSVHVTQITKWRHELLQRSAEIFAKPDTSRAQEQQELADKLHKTIGELTMENNWLKKKLQLLG